MNITVIKVIQFIFENYWAFSNRKWKNNIFTKNLISIKNRKIGKFFNSISLDAFQFVDNIILYHSRGQKFRHK